MDIRFIFQGSREAGEEVRGQQTDKAVMAQRTQESIIDQGATKGSRTRAVEEQGFKSQMRERGGVRKNDAKAERWERGDGRREEDQRRVRRQRSRNPKVSDCTRL